MDYIVETQFEGPGFVAVPNSVAQLASLPADALGVLVWLASLPKGFAIRRSSILERFGFGKDKWQSVARSLSQVGALDVVTDRLPGGQFSRRYVVRWPTARACQSGQSEKPETAQSHNSEPAQSHNSEPAQSTGAGKPGSGVTGAGKSAKVWRKIRQNVAENPALYKETNIKNTSRVRSASARAASPAKGQAAQSAVGKDGSTVDPQSLTDFQRASLRQSRAVIVGGVLLQPESQAFQRLSRSIRGELAMKGAQA